MAPLSSMLFFAFCFLFFHSSAGKVSPGAHRLTVELADLLPSATCNRRSVQAQDSGRRTQSSLEVIHRHGPCGGGESKAPTAAELFVQDQGRVDFIHSKFSGDFKSVDRLRPSKATKIPAKSGATIGSGNYIVNVALGTPKKYLSLIFDTGSDLTWTQCEPCARYCYSQKDPVFAPSQSTTYSNITCSSPICSQLESGTGNQPGCSTAKSCIYGIQYGDQSFSVGYFAKETLTLTPTDVISNFLFGCGQNNRGLFGSAAGLIGLGQDKISIVKQTAQKYGQIFSYCLPKTSSSTGYLAFGGSGGGGGALKYTPITKAHGVANFYGVDIVGMKVGGIQIPISASVFSTSGAIIDSGTVITRLPPDAYSALKSAFQKGMTKYPKAPELSILDTCYDLSKYTSVEIPKVDFLFKGGTVLELDGTGILYGASTTQVCLAFAGNMDPSTVAIIGNVQQKTLQVVYDVGGGKIGFGYNGC
ncbi:aspartyl protease family protein At5g10770-like [Cucurbita pepo subsp. pepo]|uniref:aspartyl protease family protein At5g10770-like n=1 Tax=Cucurbita pepo subsp. pepo TaxID=3664 RepID=UPI000C9D5D51|nr:aspartyl protease family protein At5g10770-like [Cucurbita pepo subsp. pepo]